MTPDIFIGMPVYRGEQYITETLHSIRDQTYDRFHVVMSVDGFDDPTIEACRRFTDDPRFELVVQPERLGWPGNFNWLVRNCDREFFCYWQQDDPASPDYLRSLRTTLETMPAAALAYTDVQWIGDRSDLDTAVEIHGSPLERTLQEVEALHYVPLRGLVRADCVPDRADPIPLVPTSGHQQEFVYLAGLAAAGDFVRTPRGLYYKRCHDENAHAAWFAQPDASRRDEWCALGDGLIGVVQRAAPDSSPLLSTSLVLDRLTIARPGRGFFFMPAQAERQVSQFIREFFGRYPSRLRELEPAGRVAATGFERPVHPWVASAVEHCRRDLAQIDQQLRAESGCTVVLGTGEHDEGTLLLGRGWNEPEPWGVWSSGDLAELVLPICDFRRVELLGHPFAPHGPVRVGISLDGGAPVYHECAGEIQIGVDLPVDRDPRGELSLRLHTPDATSPLAAVVSGDPRRLGFELRGIALRR